MNRTISSLAILKVNWDRLGRGYIEDFVPFVKALLERKKAGPIVSWLELGSEEVEFLTKMNRL